MWAGARGNPVLALEQPWRSHGLNTLVRALIASLAVAFVVPAPGPSHSVRVTVTRTLPLALESRAPPAIVVSDVAAIVNLSSSFPFVVLYWIRAPPIRF